MNQCVAKNGRTPNGTPKRFGRAWVLGGSVAGLLAARVLSDHYEHVFIVDREKHLGEQAPRKGAPQGRHVHAFLPRGVTALEKLFPGIFDEIIQSGATNGDLCGDAQWCPGGHRLKRRTSDLRVIAATRPFTESFITNRVTQIPNISFLHDTVGSGFRVENGRITGVKLRNRSGAERTEDADLFVDAAGRGSQLPKWLKENGYKEPREDTITVKLHYATVRFKQSTASDSNLKAVIIGAAPNIPRGGFAQAVEHDVLQCSMAAYASDLPSDIGEFIQYAKTLPQQDLYDWVRNAEPIDDCVKTQRVPVAYRRHFDRVRGLPEGILAIGDSVCAFNPVYAQGMTVAAVEAEMLGECIGAGREQLAKRFFKAIRKVTGIAWQIGSTNDLGLPEVIGKRSLMSRIVAKWIDCVQKVGATDAYVAERFIRVAALVDPPTSLLSPAFTWRVLRGGVKELSPEKQS